MGIGATFAEVDQRYRNAGKCLEAARTLVESVGAEFERSLIIVSQASREEKFQTEFWPFHASVVGYHDGLWFGGSPGNSGLFCEENLEDLVADLVVEFGGVWPSAEVIEREMIKGTKEIEVYADDWVC